MQPPMSGLAEMTNTMGVHNLVKACISSGVNELIHVSTTAVYGSGPHRGQTPEELQYAPESYASSTRAAGDAAVLAAGGTVLRPSLVYGDGDKWLLPGLARMFTALGATIDEGAALLSVIDVSTLGALIAAVATVGGTSGVYHASAPVPVTLQALSRIVESAGRVLNLDSSVSLDTALGRLVPEMFTEHQVRMIGQDHWYDSAPIWKLVREPGAC